MCMSDDGGWAGSGFDMIENLRDNKPEAAAAFLRAAGLPENPDAVNQLIHGFLPALRIICERNHDPNGATWKMGGLRGQLFEMRKKSDRLWYRAWLRGIPDEDSANDMINYGGFYIRALGLGLTQWGEWGDPTGFLGMVKPEIVCICGSTRFADLMNHVAEEQTLAGRIVVRPEVVTYSAPDDPQHHDMEAKERLDILHLRKIELSDLVIVVSRDGYIGDSTRREIDHCIRIGKPVLFIEESARENFVSEHGTPAHDNLGGIGQSEQSHDPDGDSGHPIRVSRNPGRKGRSVPDAMDNPE